MRNASAEFTMAKLFECEDPCSLIQLYRAVGRKSGAGIKEEMHSVKLP
jgi:hypothetical protein